MSLASVFARASSLMGSRLSRNGLLSLGQAVITILAYFIVMQQVVSIAGLEALGLWSVAMSLVAFVRMLDLGGIQVLAKLVAASADDEVGQAYFVDSAAIASLVAFCFIATIAYVGLKPILHGSIDPSLYRESDSLLIGIVAVLPLTSLALVHLGALDGIGRADIRALISIISVVLYAVTAFLLLDDHGIFALVYGQFVQQGFAFIFSRGLVCKQVGTIGAWPTKLSLEKLNEIFSFGARLQVSILPLALFEPLCRLVIGRSVGLELLGIYELASKFAASTRQLIAALGNPIMPEFARLLVADERAAKERFATTQPLIVLFAMLGTIAQIISLPIASLILIGKIDPVFILSSSAISLAWGVACIGLVPQMYARAAGYLRYAIIGQWVMLILGSILLALANILRNDVAILIAPAISIIVGYVIAYLGEVRRFGLSYFGDGAAFHVLGVVFTLTLVALAAIGLSILALGASS
jgi:O-antigen/teichoic acid export membrane protein